jgi:hypothetical protein
MLMRMWMKLNLWRPLRSKWSIKINSSYWSLSWGWGWGRNQTQSLSMSLCRGKLWVCGITPKLSKGRWICSLSRTMFKPTLTNLSTRFSQTSSKSGRIANFSTNKALQSTSKLRKWRESLRSWLKTWRTWSSEVYQNPDQLNICNRLSNLDPIHSRTSWTLTV